MNSGGLVPAQILNLVQRPSFASDASFVTIPISALSAMGGLKLAGLDNLVREPPLAVSQSPVRYITLHSAANLGLSPTSDDVRPQIFHNHLPTGTPSTSSLLYTFPSHSPSGSGTAVTSSGTSQYVFSTVPTPVYGNIRRLLPTSSVVEHVQPSSSAPIPVGFTCMTVLPQNQLKLQISQQSQPQHQAPTMRVQLPWNNSTLQLQPSPKLYERNELSSDASDESKRSLAIKGALPGKHICPYCSRSCAKPSVLEKHLRAHTGERPFPCEPCGFK